MSDRRRVGMRPVTTDPEAQSVYIRLCGGTVVTTPEVPIVCNLDLDKDGRVLGIELLGLVVDLERVMR